jgi:hypothetical protein
MEHLVDANGLTDGDQRGRARLRQQAQAQRGIALTGTIVIRAGDSRSKEIVIACGKADGAGKSAATASRISLYATCPVVAPTIMLVVNSADDVALTSPSAKKRKRSNVALQAETRQGRRRQHERRLQRIQRQGLPGSDVSTQ